MFEAYLQIFSVRGSKFRHFFKLFFQKVFENLHTAIAILVLTEQFSGKFCLNFSVLILSASPNNFFLHIFDYVCLGVA